MGRDVPGRSVPVKNRFGPRSPGPKRPGTIRFGLIGSVPVLLVSCDTIPVPVSNRPKNDSFSHSTSKGWLVDIRDPLIVLMMMDMPTRKSTSDIEH